MALSLRLARGGGGTVLHSWAISLVEGTGGRDLGLGSVLGKHHAPPLHAEPLRQAHPCLPGKADESTPGDKELSRTRLATPNHGASATNPAFGDFSPDGVLFGLCSSLKPPRAAATDRPAQVLSPRGRGPRSRPAEGQGHKPGPQTRQETERQGIEGELDPGCGCRGALLGDKVSVGG